MSIGGKINALGFTMAIVLACLLTGFIAPYQYQVELDSLDEASRAKVLSRPQLQIDIYQRNQGELEQALGDFMEPPAVSFAAAYNSLAQPLAIQSRNETAITELPIFGLLRGGLSAVEPGLRALDAKQEVTGTRFWSSLFDKGASIHLTVPVFTAINPTVKGLGEQAFFAAMSAPKARQSLVVIGYVHLGIEPAQLRAGIYPALGQIFFGSLFILLLCAVIVARLTRQFTVPLSQLGKIADKLASGELSEQVEISGSKEFRDIAFVLNRVIGGMSDVKRESDAGHNLLNLKLDQRESQLSMSKEELDKAAEEIAETRKQLHQSAYYDELTRLPNRRLFTEQLNLLLRMNPRSGKPLALLFINLDNFKRVNESLGLSAGDQLLQEIGQRLTACLRNSDVLTHHPDSGSLIDVSRLGGDEFSVVLNHLDSIDSAGVVARRVIDTLSEPVMVGEHEVVVNPSIGIAIAPRDAGSVEGLLKAATIAMFHAKASATESVLYYHADLDVAGPEHLRLESDLRKAIERNELVLHYQPQVDTSNGAIVGAEALLRWQHPEYGEVPPFKFIAIAEEIGIIAQLGDWVLVEACRQIKEFRDNGLELPRVAINISQFQFDARFVERVKEVLLETDLPPTMLELSLTEELLVDGDESTDQALADLKSLGVYLTLDDFGTNAAPLNYLSRYSLDELRIDKSFVVNCEKHAGSAALVTGIIAMIRSLGLRLVAEGIESEEQFRFLSDNGVRLMQGYLFSRPVPAGQLREMLVVPWHFAGLLQRIALQDMAGQSEL